MPTVDYSRVGRIKSAGVIWGVLSSASVESEAASIAPKPEPAPVAYAALQPDVPPPPSEDELLTSAAVELVVEMSVERPAPTAEDMAWLLSGEEAVAAVRAKALKARRDGTDSADLFSDANGARWPRIAPCAPHCSASRHGTAARGAPHSLSPARRPPGLVAYIASLPRDEQVEMEPGLRCAAVATALPFIPLRADPCVPHSPLTRAAALRSAAMDAKQRVSDSKPDAPADPELVALYCGCAWLCAARGDFAEADALYRDALKLLRRRAEAATAVPEAKGGILGAFGKLAGGNAAPERPSLPAGPAAELQLCLSSLAKLAQARGALNEAEALWRDALAAADALFGAGSAHANAAARDATRALALLAAARGQDTQSAKLFREAAALERALEEAQAQPLPARVAA